MSLGVLNNLNAMYAENNLNNTSNSLSKVLNQLSSGSKINSGADDAAGLSLVDGLQANSAALAQSQTNAQEGVGLLQVADGALSQVTSLLNRAVTLATEASNGTLNSSQDTAANNEYQSILSEINNIGATTTYNGTAVFGNASTKIYTGDSSTVGASIDALNISSLSSSNVGDTGGVMAYSNGNNNVFLNLSSGSANGANAQATDTLNASGTTTINVNYLVSGANGTKTSASTSISVGGSTGYTNTANGLISAINGAGIGLTASFTTQAQAGVSGGGTQTGIQITGGLLSVGVAPSTVSTGGILNLSGSSANSLLSPNQNVSIQSGSAAAISINVTPSIKTLSDLASAINMQSAANAGNSALTQVVATVVTNADNSQSLSLVDSNPSGGQLSVNDTAYTYTPQLTANTAVTGAAVNLSFTATQTGNAAIAGSPATSAVATLGIGGITNSASDALTGSIVLSNGASGNITINMGAGSDSNSGSTINLSTANSNLTGLMNALNVTTGGSASAALGVTAAVSSSGLTMTSIAGNTTIATTSGALSSAPTVSLQSSQNGAAAFAGTVGTTVISMINGTGLNGGDNLAAGSSITVTNSSLNSPGTPITFMVGASTGAANTFYTGGGNMTLSNLVGIMNSGAGAAAAGLSGAVLSGANGNITLTSATVGTTISTTSTVAEQVSTNGTTYTAAIAQNLVGSSSSGASLGTSVGLDANLDPIGLNGDKLAGSLVLTNGSSAVTVTFGAASDTNSGTAIGLTAANSTLTGLMNALNVMTSGSASLALGMTATMNATNTGLDFATTKTGTTMNVNTAGMTNVSTMEFTNPTTAGVGINASGTIALSDSGKITGNPATTAGAGTITGQVMITSGSVVDTFVMGSNAANTINGNTNTINVNGNSLNDLIAAIANESTGGKLGGASLGVSAVQDTATGGIFLQSTVANTPLSVDTSGLTDVMAEAKNNGTVGAPIVPTAIPAQVIFGTGTTNSATDVVAGQIVIQNSGGINPGGTTTFIMGGSAYNSGNPAATGLGTNAVTVNGNTLADLARAINADSTGAYAGTAGVDLIAAASDNKGLTVKAATQSDVLSNYTSTLQDQYALANGVVGSQGQAATAATYATASLGTGQKIGSSAELSGNIVLNNGGVNYTFTMANSSAGSTSTAINTSAKTLAALQAAITQSNIGINASIDGNGVLQLQSTNPATSITVASSALVDTQGEAFTGGSGSAGSPATAPHASMATVTLAGNSTAALAADMLNGSITLTGTGGTETFTMGGLTSGSLNNGGTLGVGSASNPFSENLNALAQAITGDSALGITAQVTTQGLSLTMNADVATPISGVISSSLQDTSSAYSKATATFGSFDSQSDMLSGGTLAFSVGGQAESVSVGPGSLNNLMAAVNGASNTDPYGVHASWDSVHNSVVLTADAYGAAGNLTATSSNLTDTTSGRSLAYTAAAAYNVGISNSTSSSTALYDSSDQTNPTLVGTNTKFTNFVANTAGTSGIATISYSDGAGQSLTATDLSNQTDAQAALTALSKAITDVAAQDGYIGAQINTLNAVSSVLSTQQQNVVSAQNAVQATDYASATSNMSKYEILSQTGISALAQANSMQQEVTKLLQ